MHCDMLKIQDGGAIVEKLNSLNLTLQLQGDGRDHKYTNTVLEIVWPSA